MLSKEIRNKFIKFFEDHEHTHVKSGSLVPYNDPTLLFTNAGMNQFKDVFLGIDKRDYSRATTSQKCVRAGGKHNDLETVGKTARHHTFFEMLGNFSFGDYFKKDAIHYAWTFLTEELKLPKDKLWITVYQDDDEAFQLWKDETDFPDDKILRLGEKDNFWQMGDVGPCGPCSEIHIDRGSEYACDCQDGCKLGVCDCDRWLEIWNLVFMQYNRNSDGTLTPLPKPSVDTGMGLERITSVLQNVDNNWETDLFIPLLEFVEELSGKKYYSDKRGFPFRVIVDHARACTFLIADGVLPSNEGRGYVLRRILRRAIRLGRSIGLEDAFLYKFPEKIGQLMSDVYPEIAEQKDFIVSTIKGEELRFLQTLQDGLKRVQESIDEIKANKKKIIDGKTAFLFYDTYGFPIDLTKDIAEENNVTVDVDGFDRAMEEQRQKSKDAQNKSDVWELAKIISQAYPDLIATTFTGYTTLEDKGTVKGIVIEQEAVDFGYDATAKIILDKSPFYATGGGQVGDQGKCLGENGVFQVENTIKLPNGVYILEGYIDGRIDVGEVLKLEVDESIRKATARNHTATHLLHYALKTILGDNVHQAGSMLDAEHLRFDFSQQKAMTANEIRQVEQLVNEKILAGGIVESCEMSIDEAKENGFIALFGEKYGDRVRGIKAANFSKELCGGTHVCQLGDIGLFKIVSESAVSAGIRRIEALTGKNAYEYLLTKERLLHDVEKKLKVTRNDEILNKIDTLEAQLKEAKKEISQLKATQVKDALGDKLKGIRLVQGFEIFTDIVTAETPDELRTISDQYRDHIKSGMVVLGSVTQEGKVQLVCMRTNDEAAQVLHAGNVIKELAAQLGGKGGGRPDLAQAGGKDADKLELVLKDVIQIIEKQIM